MGIGVKEAEAHQLLQVTGRPLSATPPIDAWPPTQGGCRSVI